MRPVSTSLTACGSGTHRDRSSLSSSGLPPAPSSASAAYQMPDTRRESTRIRRNYQILLVTDALNDCAVS